MWNGSPKGWRCCEQLLVAELLGLYRREAFVYNNFRIDCRRGSAVERRRRVSRGRALLEKMFFRAAHAIEATDALDLLE